MALQDAGTIPKLLPFLGRTNPVTLQLEALHALYNLCKISRTRQEAAAVAGVVPRLIALVSSASAKVCSQAEAYHPVDCSDRHGPMRILMHRVIVLACNGFGTFGIELRAQRDLNSFTRASERMCRQTALDVA